jgi:hypothetical protein
LSDSLILLTFLNIQETKQFSIASSLKRNLSIYLYTKGCIDDEIGFRVTL